MDGQHIPPQPGRPEQAHRLLPLGRLGVYILLGVGFCVAATLAFLVLAEVVLANTFATFDDAAILSLRAIASPAVDAIMLLLTTLGDPVALAIWLILAGAALLRQRRWIDAAGLALVGAGAGILNSALKSLYQRVRPDLFDGPFQLTSFSFPSGHAMGAIACYGMLALLGARLMSRPQHRLLLVAATTLLVFGVGFSRVYFGVHYPTDVLGGFIAGAAWLVAVTLILRTAEWYAQRRTRRRV